MKSVIFLGVTIIIDGKVDVNQYDLGAVTLECKGRSYIVDVVESSSEFANGQTVIEAKVAVDKETFDETHTKYDLLPEDFFNKDFKGMVYIGCEYDEEPESQTLFIQFDGGLTKAVDLTID